MFMVFDQISSVDDLIVVLKLVDTVTGEYTTKTLIVNVVNRSETNAMAANVILQSGEFTGKGTIKQIKAESLTSTNSRTLEAVAITGKDIEFQGSKISYNFPAHSFTQMLIPVR